jgi:hypothetical protein
VVDHLHSTTKIMRNGYPTEQTHVGLDPTVLPISWDSVLNLSTVCSSALQTVLRIKMWDAHWCWGVHLNLAMPGKDSTALNIELTPDESLTPFPMSLCSSEPFLC